MKAAASLKPLDLVHPALLCLVSVPRLVRIVLQPNMMLKKVKRELNAVHSAHKLDPDSLRGWVKNGRYTTVRGEL